MLKKVLFSAVLLSLFAMSTVTAQDNKHFGEMIDAKGATSFSKLSKKMGDSDTLDIKLKGTVASVCQVKGCWMVLQAKGQEDMRVTFKDYGFFMPKDLAGKQVVMEGFAYVTETPVDVLRHYAEDAGKSKEEIMAITEPLREVAYEARGVVILD